MDYNSRMVSLMNGINVGDEDEKNRRNLFGESRADVWQGIILPEYLSSNEDEIERDYKYIKKMYPKDAKDIQLMVEEECDKLEYEGSIMLSQYPDKVSVFNIANKIYDKVKNKYEGDIQEASCKDCEDDKRGPISPPYVPNNKRPYETNLMQLIEVLLCNEFCIRRNRYKRHKQNFNKKFY